MQQEKRHGELYQKEIRALNAPVSGSQLLLRGPQMLPKHLSIAPPKNNIYQHPIEKRDLVVTSIENHRKINLFKIIEILNNKFKIFR